jgi:hypothetical protein
MQRGELPSDLLKTKREREQKSGAAQSQQTKIEHPRGLTENKKSGRNKSAGECNDILCR